MVITSLSTIALIHLIAVASPGPDFAAVTKASMSEGWRAGTFTAAGVLLGNLVHIILALTGLGYVIGQNPALLMGIRWVGAAYLVYIGVKCLLSRGGSLDPVSDPATPSAGGLRALWLGFFTCVLNPKALLYFVSVFSQVVNTRGAPTIGLYGAVTLGISSLWFLSLAQLVAWEPFRRRFLKASKWIDRSMGVVFMAFAATMLLAG